MQSKPELKKVGCHWLYLFNDQFVLSDALYVFGAEKYHGVILIPEGLVESIPELYALLQVVSLVIEELQLQDLHHDF